MLFFSLLLYVVILIISIKHHYSSKTYNFECGFMKKGNRQPLMSIHFFMVVLIFIIFDFEIVLFLGVVTYSVQSILSVFLLYLFILAGLYVE
jgi:NADH:ubiquinone oxidoreductase subunit 3 (subunit A)